jgi:Asp-tRNA(Asn)/Glu-tRNA(Gln) amidotransferase A subunit family amidase
MFDLLEATIPQMRAALVTGATSSRAMVATYLARIAAFDQQGPALNAISAVNQAALAEAEVRDAERRDGTARGALHGIPVIVKDNYETADMPTANGSAALKGWIPPGDAEIVRRLRDAGAIIIAKSNMHEFARGITTIGSLFGATRNPYDPARNPGGSSGGTGAAIAANFAAVGLGSDTCGSIRIPSAHNSLAGIRPTQGLTSRAGIIPLSSTQDIGGPMGRSVTDVAIVLDAIAGYDRADAQTAASVGHIPSSYTDFLHLGGLRGARIGVLGYLFGDDPLDEEIGTVVHAATADMVRLGARVEPIEIPDLDALISDRASGFSVLSHDFKFDLNAYLATRPTAPVRSLEEILASGKFHPELEAGLRSAQALETRGTAEYWEGLARREQLRLAILQTMAEHRLDAIAYPPIRRKASLLGEAQLGHTCRLASNSGLPAIVVPAGFTPDGMPVGLELLGRAWSEPGLFRLAYAYEQGTRHRRPPASTP